MPVWKEFYDWLCLTDKAAIPSDRNEEEPIAVDNGNDSDVSSSIEAAAMAPEVKPHAVPQDISFHSARLAVPSGREMHPLRDEDAQLTGNTGSTRSIRNSIAQPMEEETLGPLPPKNTKTAHDAGNDGAQPMETDEDADNGMAEPMEEEASTPPLDGDTNYTEEREKKGLTKPPATTCRHQWQEARRNR